MDVFTIGLWAVTFIFLIISAVKDRHKTAQALKKAFGIGRGMVVSILSIIFTIGLILTLIPPAKIAEIVSAQSLVPATVVSALFGTIALIPAFIAFPLVGTLIKAGVSIVPAIAFLTTLTMVGIVTFPLEKRTFGLKFTLLRNSLSLLFAVMIALVMGVII